MSKQDTALQRLARKGHKEERARIAAKQAELAARLQKMDALSFEVGQVNAETVPVYASINDPYEQLYSRPYTGCVSVSGKGLKDTIEKLEREYHERSGRGVRTDGALRYHVIMTVGDVDIDVPPAQWVTYSAQTLASAKQRKR